MKGLILPFAGSIALAACSPYADEPVARTTPTTVVTYEPVAAPAPAYYYYQVAPATVYQTPATVLVPQRTTYVVQEVPGDPPRGYGVSVGTSPQPILTPNQKEQDKTMAGH
jgi:hypothetical protein